MNEKQLPKTGIDWNGAVSSISLALFERKNDWLDTLGRAYLFVLIGATFAIMFRGRVWFGISGMKAFMTGFGVMFSGVMAGLFLLDPWTDRHRALRAVKDMKKRVKRGVQGSLWVVFYMNIDDTDDTGMAIGHMKDGRFHVIAVLDAGLLYNKEFVVRHAVRSLAPHIAALLGQTPHSLALVLYDKDWNVGWVTTGEECACFEELDEDDLDSVREVLDTVRSLGMLPSEKQASALMKAMTPLEADEPSPDIEERHDVRGVVGRAWPRIPHFGFSEVLLAPVEAAFVGMFVWFVVAIVGLVADFDEKVPLLAASIFGIGVYLPVRIGFLLHRATSFPRRVRALVHEVTDTIGTWEGSARIRVVVRTRGALDHGGRSASVTLVLLAGIMLENLDTGEEMCVFEDYLDRVGHLYKMCRKVFRAMFPYVSSMELWSVATLEYDPDVDLEAGTPRRVFVSGPEHLEHPEPGPVMKTIKSMVHQASKQIRDYYHS